MDLKARASYLLWNPRKSLISFIFTPTSSGIVAFYALIFALSLESENREIIKKNIVLVCSSGNGSEQLLVDKFKYLSGRYLNKMRICRIYEIDKFDFGYVYYVLTTVPLNVSISVLIFELNLFMKITDLNLIRKALNSEQYEI